MCKWHGIYIYIYIYNFYINDMPFLFMMSWYEVHTIYILTKFVQTSWYNFGGNYAIFVY
jgi:hypothetical protein